MFIYLILAYLHTNNLCSLGGFHTFVTAPHQHYVLPASLNLMLVTTSLNQPNFTRPLQLSASFFSFLFFFSTKPQGEFGGVLGSSVPGLCCNYKSSLQLPCDFDVTRKSFRGCSVFMRFPFNQNKAEREARQAKQGAYTGKQSA